MWSGIPRVKDGQRAGGGFGASLAHTTTILNRQVIKMASKTGERKKEKKKQTTNQKENHQLLKQFPSYSL
jgi:hypothetical protein